MQWIRARQARLASERRELLNKERDEACLANNFGVDRKALIKLATVREKSMLAELGGVAKIRESLRSSAADGLASDAEADIRRKCFGVNKLPPKRVKWWLEHFWESITDLTLLILMAGATISVIFGVVTSRPQDSITGGAIFIAVAVVACTTSTVNYVQEAQFRSLAAVKEDREVLVVRGGEERSISVFDVVVGDVFVAKAGELLPCDGLLLSGAGLKADESAMTGESLEVPKTVEGDPFLVSGSQLTAGAGRMLVIAVGEESFYGNIVRALEDVEPPPTPLQEKLERLAKRIGYLGMACGTFNLLILIILFFAVPSRQEGNPIAITILSFFLLSVTIVVVAVPEGLPMAVILSLAFSMKRMIKDKVLVRKLNSVETMGSATSICSDKTGTLTLNQMTVTAGHFFGTTHISTVPTAAELGATAPAAAALALAISLNSDASVAFGTNAQGQATTTFNGNKTEGAMLLMLKAAFGIDYAALRKAASAAAARADGSFGTYRENFSSSRKRMTTLVPLHEAHAVAAHIAVNGSAPGLPAWIPAAAAAADAASGSQLALTKGAAEMVLQLCSGEAGPTGAVLPIDAGRRAQLEATITALASQGLRTLAVAVGHVSAQQVARILALVGTEVPDLDAPTATQAAASSHAATGAPSPTEAAAAAAPRTKRIATADDAWAYAIRSGQVETGLTLMAVVGIRDPPRPEVPAAVAACKRSFVKVRMVTGDNLETAKAIAREVGIYEGGIVMEGAQWRELTPEQRRDTVARLDVLARAIPTDKLLMVQALQELGEVVAVTGDGSNDAPALNAAHVGCAMGIAGTEVAKEAADLVILDDNFASIVNAILWGRAVLENIRKFLAFQLVVNVSACTLTVIMAIIQGGAATNFPLTPIQLLWINLIMDSFAALALATEPPDKALLKHRPEGKTTSLISGVMKKMIAGQSVFQTALLLFLTLSDAGAAVFSPALAGKSTVGYSTGSRPHLCCIFNTFVFLTLFNKMNARKLHDEWNLMAGFFHAWYAPVIMIGICVAQALLVEFGGEFVFQTTPLLWSQWLVCIALGLTTFPVGFLLRFFKSPDPTVVTDEQYEEMMRQQKAKGAADHAALTVAAASAVGDKADASGALLGACAKKSTVHVATREVEDGATGLADNASDAGNRTSRSSSRSDGASAGSPPGTPTSLASSSHVYGRK